MDLFTRRYLDFCEHSNQQISDYVKGIKRENMSKHDIETIADSMSLKRRETTVNTKKLN